MGLIAASENHLQGDAYKSPYVDLPVIRDSFILTKTRVLSLLPSPPYLSHIVNFCTAYAKNCVEEG